MIRIVGSASQPGFCQPLGTPSDYANDSLVCFMAKPPLCTGVNAVSMTADFSILSRRHRWLSFGCFCASFLLLALGVWHLDRQQTDAHRARVTVLAGDTAQAVQSRMSRLMSATYLLSA
jgi:hypothetical protein